MTRDEVLEMAVKCGFHRDSQSFYNNSPEQFIDRFAALVAERTREEFEKMEPVAWEYATDLSEDRILTNKNPSQMQDWLGRAAPCITSARPLYAIKIK